MKCKVHETENQSTEPIGQTGNPEITGYTVKFWHDKAGIDLVEEDARDMVANVLGFFQVLEEWERVA
ncbi:MAG: hypothetical protein ACYC4F_09550 [Armatimonadota bacterium]